MRVAEKELARNARTQGHFGEATEMDAVDSGFEQKKSMKKIWKAR